MLTKRFLVINMIDLLICRKDKVNKNSEELNVMCYKRGYVIVAMPDTHQWSRVEMENPDWIIVSVDMTIGDAESFLQVEDPIAAREAQPLLKRRMMKLNLDSLTTRIKAEERAKDVFPWKEKFNHEKQDIIDNIVIQEPAATLLVRV